MAKETTQFFNDTQFSQGTSISPTSANTKTTNATLETATSKEINENKNINKVKTLSQDDYEINYSISPSLTSNISSSHNNTNESSESSEDEGYETPSKEPYENKYIKLSTIDALDFLATSDESNALTSDILSVIRKATNLTFVLCLVSSILAALYSFWFINNSGIRFYTLCALFWSYYLYKLNSSSLSLKETINTAKKIAMGIAIYQFSIYILSNNVEADLFDRNPLLYAGSVLSIPFLILLEEVLEAYQKENCRKQALLKEERINSQRSLYKAIDRFSERKGLYLRTISDQLRQTTDMAMETLKQLSPPHFLSKPHEQLSACSLSFPTASISAIHTTIRDINYISTHLGTLSLLLFSEQDNREISHVKREFDIGEIVQHVGDVLAGGACNANVELVIYHVEYGLNHLNVIGDEAAFRHSLLDLLKCIIDGASPGDCVELGLGLQIRSLGESESRGLSSEKERTINPHDKVICTIEIIYNTGVIGSKESNRSKPVFIIPNANLTHKILNFLGASLKMEDGREEQNSQRLEISIELEAGSPLAPPNIPNIDEESRRRYPHLRITGEPSIEELIKTSQNMRGQRVALHATSKSQFAKHITSCLTTWGTDISHVPIGGENEFETPSSETASSLESETGAHLGVSEEYKNHDELQQSLNANLPPTFIIIDDDIETLKHQLTQLGKVPFQLTAMAVRSKRPGQAPTLPPQTTAIIHFTSLANYKSVKDAVQCIISPTAGSFSLPQVLVIPKPAGPRRFLTALHTTINRIVVDPVFMPIATSPMSPSQQDSNGGIKSSTDLGSKLDSDAQFTESPGNYFPPNADCMYRPSTPSCINNNPQSPSGNSLVVVPKHSRNPDVQSQINVVVPPNSPGRNFQSMGPLSPIVGIGAGTSAKSGSPGIGTGIAIGTSPSVPIQPPSSPPPQSPLKSQPSVNNDKKIRPRKPKPIVDTVIPPVNVLIVEDNPINQAILSTFMKRKKIKYECASNGQEAVDKWQKGGFHMVLMDIQLPVMDGIEATKKIRSLEKSRKIGVFSSTPLTACSSSSTSASSSVSSTPISTPMQQTPPSTPDLGLPVVILALTASSLSIDRQNALAAGCNDFLTKPVSLVWLEKKIQEWGSMQALVDFDGWRKWKKFEYGLEDKKDKKAEQVTNVIVKKSNSEDSGKHSKQKQPSQVNVNCSTSENNKPSIKITSRSTLPTKMPSNSNSDNEVLNTPNQKNTLISPLQRSLASSPTSPTSTPTLFPSLLQTPSGGIKISPAGVVSSRQNTPSPPPIVIKPSTPQSNSESTEPNTESNITSPKISTANNVKNNIINNNLLTITTNTSTPSTINNTTSSQPSTPLSTLDPPKIVRKRGSTISSVTGVNMSVGDQNVI